MLRLEYGWDASAPKANHALALRLSPNRTWLEFDRVFSMPGGQCKFTLRPDNQSRSFLALTNNATNMDCPSARNLLTLTRSKGLLSQWEIASVVLRDDQGFAPDDSNRFTAFSYADWVVDGEDMLVAIRTAYRGAVSYHNTNRITFKRIERFRSLL